MTNPNLPDKYPRIVFFQTETGKVYITGELDEKLVRANFTHTTIKIHNDQI